MIAEYQVQDRIRDFFSENSDKKIAIWGNGEHTLQLIEFLKCNEITTDSIKAIIAKEDNGHKQQKIPIIKVDDAFQLLNLVDFIVISSYSFQEEIAHEIERLGFAKKIVKVYNLDGEYKDPLFYWKLYGKSYFKLPTNKIKEFISDRTNYIKIYERAIKWIHKNTIDNQGIIVHSQQKVCYPEVTGYFIPSLIRWGEKKLALQYARWLVSIQNEDGSWNDPLGLTAYTFDTGQILKGLVSMVDSYPEFKVAILKGCHWIVNQIDEEGRITTPDTSQWILPNGKMTPEAIHLYALEPVKLVADKWNIENFSEKIGIALKYYLQRDDLVEFDTLSHFHAYIIEALVDLGETSHAIEAMEKINHIYEQKGFIPGYHNADWVCSTAMFQYALIMYKLGWVERADKIFEYTCHLQNDTGGFFGGYGEGATYFPIEEISWANKYFLDAFWYKIHKSFNKDYSIFPEEISYNDGRYRLVEEVLGENKFHKVVDIGCGKGRYIKNLKEKYPEAELYGVDISDKMLGYLPKGVTPLLGTLLNIPLMDKEVDMAFCVEALEHAVDIPKAIQEMGRIVKEDGVLIIIDKNQERLGALEISEWEQWFDEERVTQLLEKEGFIVTVRKNISYDQKSGQDQLFIAWIARKSTRLS